MHHKQSTVTSGDSKHMYKRDTGNEDDEPLNNVGPRPEPSLLIKIKHFIEIFFIRCDIIERGIESRIMRLHFIPQTCGLTENLTLLFEVHSR